MKYIKQLSLKAKIILATGIIILAWLGYSRILGAKNNAVSYKTATVEKGTLVVTVTGSGQVSTANNGTVSTLATGVVSKLYVKDGDEVKSGDKLADIDLDLQGQQNAQQALSSYQSAQNTLAAAQAAMYTTQSDMFSKWNTFFNLATDGKYQNGDGTPNTTNRTLPEFTTADDDWLAAEAKYKNQQNVVNQAQTALSAAWSSYQQTSPTIYAPISGTVNGFSLQVGSVITASANSNNTAQSATKIASIKTKALPMVSVNLTEIDIPKIKLGDKATITFDAFSDRTFTGKVISIDTAGVVVSGVTNYPAVIKLDTDDEAILPNMAATANIITATKNDVLLVPSAAIQTQNGSSYVRVLKNGQPTNVPVSIGLSSTSQTEITSGLKEGDTVVTGVISSGTTNQNSQRTSVFGGGRIMRIGRGG